MLKIDSLEIKKLSNFYHHLSYMSDWACRYFLGLLQADGNFYCPSRLYKVNEVMRIYSIQSNFQQLLISLLDLMQEANLLTSHRNQIYSVSHNERINLSKLIVEKQHYLELYSEVSQHFTFIHSLLDKYFLILSGRESFLNCLFAHGQFDIAQSIYENNIEAVYFNKQVAAAVSSILKVRPKTRLPAKILEIGAGTGATTISVLEATREYENQFEYFYTDVSPAFLSYGYQRFSSETHLRFRAFDINKDIRLQGYDEGCCDVIVATNSLHNAVDLAWSITQIKRLLKLGGFLILSETTQDNDYSTFTFGLSTQWWSSSDKHLRFSGSPLVATKDWKKLLKASGFKVVKAMSDLVAQDESINNISQDIIVACCFDKNLVVDDKEGANAQ